LDSFGIGEEPDANLFGDVGTNTLRSVSNSPYFKFDNMGKLGFFNIDGVEVGQKTSNPTGAFARMQEASMGKDTTIGHWEIGGIISPKPFPTYPNGFPEEILKEFEKRTGRGVICNKPYSGTVVINDYGDEQNRTGKWIVYTSADSVFQIAAHEEWIPLEELYNACKIAREILTGEHAVGRVIARPYIGTSGNYTRTTNRHDFSLEPTKDTILDVIKAQGMEVLSVGKIYDIFAHRGMTDYVYTTGNTDGMNKLEAWMDRDFEGLCFVNLVDFDMLYGHRNDVDGYAKALAEFDERLPGFLSKLKDDDVFMITADHGCDPGFTQSTDHSREYVPFVAYGKNIIPGNYGTRKTFADMGATVLKYLGIDRQLDGTAIEMLKI
ncbi:MAG: phosphopentomutase, partial [Lachnospiraceae bacterium]|nr:phosphopentomutase [Lachnospiraceae bacterium]